MVTLRPKTKTDRREGRIAFRLFNIQGKKTQRQKIPAGGRYEKCSDHFLLEAARGSNRGIVLQLCEVSPIPHISLRHNYILIWGEERLQIGVKAPMRTI